jgi:small subunit ribosomal protein S5
MVDEWVPKTRLGKKVKNGEITTIGDALKSGLPLKEVEIVDVLLPDLEDEVIDINMVQRMTDSGRRVKFCVMVAVGNKDGYVGLGEAKGKEVGMAIRKAVGNGKLNLIEIRRGCGSWECGCGTPHSFPFKVKGKSGSIRITFMPAPRGTGLAVGNTAKILLRLAGINDAWAFAKGKTRTTMNYAKAIADALQSTVEMRLREEQQEKFNMASGMVGGIE